ncbi:uncharacterized protein LOC123692493 isoform X2 [Colias croceus]|uniref:uncharacterized protein LOC123692493 isoform X2 n=1 Tax=Colias crocea TaxID=72248 RepID=UPI001E27BB2A|nr:uncharacterized protein LOC123692493 isoform X2 [Colias croceus]
MNYYSYVLMVSALAAAIRVPTVNIEDNDNDSPKVESIESLNNKPIYYSSSANSPDGFLIPPIPHKREEVLRAVMATPATFLLPPSGETMIDYYKPPEAAEQNDWYPIAPEQPQNTPQHFIQNSPELTEIVMSNLRTGKVLAKDTSVLPPTPARGLLPPLENALNFYFDDDSALKEGPLNQEQLKYKKPTALYPKKVVGHFNPVPIPIAQYVDNIAEIPKAKPIRTFRPLSGVEGVYLTPSDEKKIYLYKQEEQKRKLKNENEEEQRVVPTEANNGNESKRRPSEQETSETNNHQPKRDFHPAPVKHAAKRPVYVPANKKGERTEFRMHGMNGPHSYQFGFDTGKGKNRQFRYEERDNDGHVRGHYGYVDKLGKLRVVNYDADPKLGFRADPPVVQE